MVYHKSDEKCWFIDVLRCVYRRYSCWSRPLINTLAHTSLTGSVPKVKDYVERRPRTIAHTRRPCIRETRGGLLLGWHEFLLSGKFENSLNSLDSNTSHGDIFFYPETWMLLIVIFILYKKLDYLNCTNEKTLWAELYCISHNHKFAGNVLLLCSAVRTRSHGERLTSLPSRHIARITGCGTGSDGNGLQPGNIRQEQAARQLQEILRGKPPTYPLSQNLTFHLLVNHYETKYTRLNCPTLLKRMNNIANVKVPCGTKDDEECFQLDQHK